MRRYIKSLATWLASFAILALPLTPSASAWGKTGHRVVGEIAEDYLTPKTRAAIAEIMGVEDLAQASNWADFMRSSPDEFWQKEAWAYHFFTVPEGETYAETDIPAYGDAMTALETFRATLLSDTASVEDKQLALRFIVHIVGDLHQPLHTGNGTDRGGNDVAVKFFDVETNLHDAWDNGMVDEEQLSYTELAHWLARAITPELAADWSTPDPHVWIGESTALRDTVYPESTTDGSLPELKWQYFYAHRDNVRLRLSQGGVRLAVYLNAIFDPQKDPTAVKTCHIDKPRSLRRAGGALWIRLSKGCVG